MTASPILHSHTVRLSYADTDPAGILYYAAWFPKMEALQSEFLFLQGLRQDTLKERFGWWTVSRATECEYLAAAQLFDVTRIDLRLGRIGASSFRFEFTMTRVDDDVVVARAANTVVTVSPEQSTVRIPADLRERLEAWSQP
ncbi:acyl-CoA thioesterase [Microbacterium sp. CFH 31415]|uniref:acyl-CoA thioesterase n=1 Tax=Microbacterium sp. CFH 31415 TaxID=2921732 RepID=UPI001F148B9F|nr:thioesterase family protein [Microbacterium sp. CFH 31415]MCH6231646.1 acyl-CoA thioesterase [Microbacterium sp. CFH 31415]